MVQTVWIRGKSLGPVGNQTAFVGFQVVSKPPSLFGVTNINPLNAELNPICQLLALLVAHHILHVSRIRVNMLYECLNIN